MRLVQGVEQRAFEPGPRNGGIVAFQALADLSLQRIQPLQAEGLRELVVDRRRDLFMDFLHLRRENGVLAGQIGGTVILGKGDLDIELGTRIGADQLLLESRNEAARPAFALVTLGAAARARLPDRKAAVWGKRGDDR